MFWSYEKVFQNSCRQESKKAPLTEGINPRKVYTLSWTLSWGCFFSGVADLLYNEEEILDGDSADVSSPERWQMV